jgi:autotransporter-associated beta strand protein
VISNGSFAISLPLSSSSLALSSNVSMSLTVATSSNATWSSDAVTLSSSNTLTFAYAPESQPSSTLLNTTTLSATGTNVINIVGTGWPVGTTRLIDYAGAINGGGTFVLGPLPVGLNARLTNDPTSTSIDLVVSSAVNSLDWGGFNGSGASGGLWDIATTLNWTNNATGTLTNYNEYGSGTNLLGDSVRFAPGGNFLVEIVTNVRPSLVLVTNLNNTIVNFLGSGKISGPTSLVKEGGGGTSSLYIATTNDYTGGTFINIGNITLGAENALPTAGLLYVGSPGNTANFTLNGFNQTIAGLISTGSGGGTRRILNNSTTPATLTINAAAGQTNIYAHTMGHTGVANTDPNNNFSVVKTGPGIQTFDNTGYGGTTTISGGTLLFNGNSISHTAAITVQAGGAIGGNSGGTDAIGGPITVETGGRLEPGNLAIGTLTVSNTVTLQGETVMEINRTNSLTSDRLEADSATLGGTLTLVNIGDALQGGETFTLFIGTLSGNFSALNLPALSSGLTWNTNNLSVNGTISVNAPPQPTFNSPTISGNDLVLSGTGGAPGGLYHILTSTNVATPLTNWTALATNNFDGSGAFSYTNTIAPGTPQQFFLLQVP